MDSSSLSRGGARASSAGRTSSRRRPSALPSPLTSFVGRRDEIAAVHEAIGAGRLVTLTGVGGVGKTRLAIQATADIWPDFRDGIWFVDLAAIQQGARLAQTVATALGVRDSSAREPDQRLSDHLSDRQILIVLDNCEHLLEPCARFVDELLRKAPEARVLATSRSTLEVPGERVLIVPPLSVPAPEQALSPEAARCFEAVELFAARAAAVQPGFRLDEAEAAKVALLCEQLDGLPLAIELAATWARTLSVDQIAERLEDRFGLLGGGGRATTVPRQQTLRSLIDWSFGLCSRMEQQLWSRLSVFSGRFEIDAVEGICADAELPADAILSVLDRLVGQSIVVCEEREGRAWYRLLETIRAYGSERLAETAESELLRERHADHFRHLAERLAAEWIGPDQEARLGRLRAEHDNLRLALDWYLETARAPQAQALTAALRVHWVGGGFLSEGRRWLDEALELPSSPSLERVDALWTVAWVALLQGDLEVAGARLRECERLGLSAPEVDGWVAQLHGTRAVFSGDPEGASRHFTTAVAAHRAAANTEGLLSTLFQVTVADSQRGAAESARAAGEQALALGERHGERWAVSYTLWALAYGRWLQGDPTRAAELARESLAIKQGFHDLVGCGLVLELLGWIAERAGDDRLAGQQLGAARAVWRTLRTNVTSFGPGFAGCHDRCVENVRAALGADYARTVSAGEAMSADDAVNFALSLPLPTPSPIPADDPLTRREREVAELVGQGLRNREIAASLVVSPRTVDGHMERIRAKLGARSRVEVATWVASRQQG
jgi:predicted ATPase/DNA-binding CsgD family transcriptional regulator